MKRKFTRVAAVLCGMSLLLTGCRIGNKNIVVSNIDVYKRQTLEGALTAESALPFLMEGLTKPVEDEEAWTALLAWYLSDEDVYKRQNTEEK